MDSQQFVYWLQGALEIMDPKSLNEQQIKVIKDHIALVLTKVTSVPSLIGSQPLTLGDSWKRLQDQGGTGQPPYFQPLTVTCESRPQDRTGSGTLTVDSKGATSSTICSGVTGLGTTTTSGYIGDSTGSTLECSSLIGGPIRGGNIKLC